MPRKGRLGNGLPSVPGPVVELSKPVFLQQQLELAAWISPPSYGYLWLCVSTEDPLSPACADSLWKRSPGILTSSLAVPTSGVWARSLMGKGFGFLRKTCQSVVAESQQHSELEEKKSMKKKRELFRQQRSAWDSPHGH